MDVHGVITQGERYRQWLRRALQPVWYGNLRRLEPFGPEWGRERGTPIDRFYIEQFLAAHRSAVTGRVIEIRDDRYTRQFGHAVERREILDIDRQNRGATIIADLQRLDALRSGSYDCCILTQTLQYVADPFAALRHIARILRPGGTLLATAPAISRIDVRHLPDYWRFTQSAAEALCRCSFGATRVHVRPFGNLTSAIAFLAGLSAEDLTPAELAVQDDRFPLIVGIRADVVAPERAAYRQGEE